MLSKPRDYGVLTVTIAVISAFIAFFVPVLTITPGGGTYELMREKVKHFEERIANESHRFEDTGAIREYADLIQRSAVIAMRESTKDIQVFFGGISVVMMLAGILFMAFSSKPEEQVGQAKMLFFISACLMSTILFITVLIIILVHTVKFIPLP